MHPILVLNNQELNTTMDIVKEVRKDYQDFNCPKFLQHINFYAKRLPERLLRFINEFKYNPPSSGFAVISGLPTENIGPTPKHWDIHTNDDRCWTQLMVQCLYSAALGDIFGWLTQQDGRIIHDILPIKEYENEQIGCGSKEEITWHTEDAFHDFRGDYLSFLCLKNPNLIPTKISRPDFTQLTDNEIEILFSENFFIEPDNSHLEEYESLDRQKIRGIEFDDCVSRAYHEVAKIKLTPKKIAPLFGDRKSPYMRLDPFFMRPSPLKEHNEAFKKLLLLIEDAAIEVPLKAGDCALIDNYKVVHGRKSFTPSYDGNDRWFKRINITRDIRKSRKLRKSSTCRIIS
ncbi:guanitoxin biosynthesis L-enduracididine beta-hydroxylase GntD [Microbulbifer sp. CnH-101-G]|uniref:guanitoxin biosynthesis L-enduracididine beta-hydroxylase GntD n=1 Tax=Microbulbifer sp. CnH-101-G TaxID=3243393 RepID=UPI00403A209D